MTLKEYLKSNKIRLEDFMVISGYSYSTLSKIYAGQRAGKGIAYKIEKLTNGSVTMNEIMNPVKEI